MDVMRNTLVWMQIIFHLIPSLEQRHELACRVDEMTCSYVVYGSSPLDCLGLKAPLMGLPSIFPPFGSTIFYSANDHSLEN